MHEYAGVKISVVALGSCKRVDIVEWQCELLSLKSTNSPLFWSSKILNCCCIAYSSAKSVIQLNPSVHFSLVCIKMSII